MAAMSIIATVWLSIVNLWTFYCFGRDKRRAIAGLPRMLEPDLLGLVMLGGTLGAYAGRTYYRHKTRKQPFTNQLHAILFAQCVVMGAFAAGLRPA